MKRICLHGPESTGKSTLATRLAAHFGCEVVPEYGRAYCEARVRAGLIEQWAADMLVETGLGARMKRESA